MLKGLEIEDLAGPAAREGRILEGEALEAQREEGELLDLAGKFFSNGRQCYVQRVSEGNGLSERFVLDSIV